MSEYQFSGKDMMVSAPKRILVRIPNWIGDVVMSLDAFSALRDRFPEARIDVLVRKKLKPLAECIRGVDNIFTESSGFVSWFKTVSELRRQRYDIGVVFPNSFRSALQVFNAGAGRRVGFSGHWRRLLLTDILHHDHAQSQRHQRFDYLDIVSVLGAEKVSSQPMLVTAEREWALGEINRQFEYTDGVALVGINPTASYGPAKCWFRENYAELIRRTLSHRRVNFMLFTDHEHRETCEWIMQECQTQGCAAHVTDMAGRTTLSQLIALFACCDVLVSNDSGPMHLGAGLGVAQLALFGSTDPGLTGPCADNSVVMWEKVECSPCFERVCPRAEEQMLCMRQLSVDAVVDNLLNLLDNTNPPDIDLSK